MSSEFIESLNKTAEAAKNDERERKERTYRDGMERKLDDIIARLDRIEARLDSRAQ